MSFDCATVVTSVLYILLTVGLIQKDPSCFEVGKNQVCAKTTTSEQAAKDFIKAEHGIVLKQTCMQSKARYAVVCNTPGCDMPSPFCQTVRMKLETKKEKIAKTQVYYEDGYVEHFGVVDELNLSTGAAANIFTSTVTMSGNAFVITK